MELIIPAASTLKFDIDLTAEGNIAMAGDTPAKTKTVSFKYFATLEPHALEDTLNNYDNAEDVVDMLESIFGFTYTPLSISQTITRETEDND